MAFSKNFKIADRVVGEGQPVFIIAEAGVNHNGDVGLAKKLIDVAKQAGADAVKFQTFKAENLNTRTAPKSTYHIETTGNEQSWFDLLRTQEISREMHKTLIEYCDSKGIMFLSTPYDWDSADLLEDLNAPAYKIASTDANNVPFLKHIARKKKPIILATAMCTIDEVRESVAAIKGEGGNDLILLHCTANYPAQLKDTNLKAMLTLQKEFDILVGYSDHTPDIINPIAAVAMGAVVYEKHFTLDKTLPGPDHRSSLDPEELIEMVRNIRMTESALGTPDKRPLESEKENRIKLRKSVVARVDIPAGQVITLEMLTTKRPATGIPPRSLEAIVGFSARVDIKRDSVILFDQLLQEKK